MKWTIPVRGTTKITKQFLWFPLGFGEEVRWLETAYILQAYRGDSNYNLFWEKIGWSSKSAYLRDKKSKKNEVES
jgi:hypothetical protein